jgi:hypothetical protein
LHFLKGILATWQIFFQKNPPKFNLKNDFWAFFRNKKLN